MMRHPPQSTLHLCDSKLARYRPEDIQGVEIRIVPISRAVHFPLPLFADRTLGRSRVPHPSYPSCTSMSDTHPPGGYNYRMQHHNASSTQTTQVPPIDVTRYPRSRAHSKRVISVTR